MKNLKILKNQYIQKSEILFNLNKLTFLRNKTELKNSFKFYKFYMLLKMTNYLYFFFYKNFRLKKKIKISAIKNHNLYYFKSKQNFYPNNFLYGLNYTQLSANCIETNKNSNQDNNLQLIKNNIITDYPINKGNRLVKLQTNFNSFSYYNYYYLNLFLFASQKIS